MAESNPTAPNWADPQTVGLPHKNSEDSPIASDAEPSEDWFNRSFDDLQLTPAKVKDDRWSGEDEAEQDETSQPHRRESPGSSWSGTKRGITKGDVRLAQKRTKEKRRESEKGGAAGCGALDLPGKAEDGGYRPDGRKPSPQEGLRAQAGRSNERKTRGMDKNYVGLTLYVDSPSDKRHTLIVEDERVSAKERGTGEDDEVPDERDAYWFQRNLKQLPTIFNWAQVYRVTAARLREIQSNLCDSWLQLVNSDDNNDRNDPADTEVSVKLLVTDEGDFTTVLKVFVKSDRRKECARSDALSSFKVVIRWLLGHKDNAEEVAQEAHRVLRVYPFSFVARANLFYILWRKGDRTEAVDILRPLVELRKWRPEIYERILCEEQGEIGRCLMELDAEFIPDALIILEQVVRDKPKWHHFKFFWAVSLRLWTAAYYHWTRAVRIKNMSDAILRAVDLLLQVLKAAEEEDLPVMKEAVTAELGETILIAGWNFGDQLKNVVERRCRDAGLGDAAACFNAVIETEGARAINLWRAGRFFRYKEDQDLKKSERVLHRAVTIEPKSSKAHHHLALTLKSMAKTERRRRWEQARNQRGANGQRQTRGWERRDDTITWLRKQAGDTNMKQLQASMKAEMCKILSHEDKHVNEAICHFNKALLVSNGEKSDVSYDLGLVYKALREYRKALDQFLAIADMDTKPVYVVSAFEQSGLVYLEQYCQNGTEKSLQEKGRIMLNMAILVQSRIVREYRSMKGQPSRHNIWQSLHSLGQYLRQKDVEGVCQVEATAELWLLRLLRVYADTVPVLTTLQQSTQHDATEPSALRDKLNRYLRNGHHMDAVVFSSLLRLTHEGGTLESELLDLLVGAHMQAAKARLLADLREGNMGSTFNTNIAKRLFRWVFEDTHLALDDVHPTSDDANLAHDDTYAAFDDTHPASDSARVHGSASTKRGHNSGQQKNTNASPPTQRQHIARLNSTVPCQTPEKSRNLQAAQRSPQKSDSGRCSTDKCTAEDTPLGKVKGATAVRVKERKVSRVSTEENNLPSTPGLSREIHSRCNNYQEYHVVLVHDPFDPDAERAAEDLQRLLQDTCGLKTHLTERDFADVMRRATLDAMNHSRLLLFILGQKAVSPQMESYIGEAARRSPVVGMEKEPPPGVQPSPRTRCRCLILTLDSAVPSSLLRQNRPTLPWRPNHDGTMTEHWVNNVYTLFYFLVRA